MLHHSIFYVFIAMLCSSCSYPVIIEAMSM